MYTIGRLGTDRLRGIEYLAITIFFIKQTCINNTTSLQHWSLQFLKSVTQLI